MDLSRTVRPTIILFTFQISHAGEKVISFILFAVITIMLKGSIPLNNSPASKSPKKRDKYFQKMKYEGDF